MVFLRTTVAIGKRVPSGFKGKERKGKSGRKVRRDIASSPLGPLWSHIEAS
jgi:hypothetical protein